MFRLRLASVAAALAGRVAAAEAAVPPAQAAELVWREGPVQVFAGDTRRWHGLTVLPYPLDAEDEVATSDGVSRIALADGGQLELSEDARLKVVAASPLSQTVELRSGTLKATGARGETWGLVIRARAGEFRPQWGTFTLRVKKKEAQLTVSEGAVKFVSAQGERLLTPQTGAVWLSGGQASPAPRAAPALPVLPTAAAPTGKTVPELLRQLEEEPGRVDTLAALNAEVVDAYKGYVKDLKRLDEPTPDDERRAILRSTYRSLALQIDDEALQSIFLRGHSVFEAGRYLEAVERFGLCRLLAVREGWLRDALDEYLKRQLPRAVERKAREMPRGAADYRAAYRAVSARDWPGAAGALARLPMDDEARALASAATERAKIAAGRARPDRTLLDMLRAGEERDRDVVRRLEDLMLAFPSQTALPWWQKAAEGLRRAYFDREIASALDKARAAQRAGDAKTVIRLLVGVLQKSPGNLDALGLLEQMQQKAAQVPAAAVFAPAPAPKARAVKRAPRPAPAPRPAEAAPSVKPRAPTLAELVQAEAYYNRGLKAYLQGDMPRAVEEWRDALKLNPGQEQADKALKRALKELGEHAP